MKNVTFTHPVRPIPMLLTGALVLFASCGSTPDEPRPAPVELLAEEPVAEEPAIEEPVAEEALAEEAAPEEEEVDLQVAGMRAALQEALRESGIDPDTMEVEGGVEAAPVAPLVAEAEEAEPAFEENGEPVASADDAELEEGAEALEGEPVAAATGEGPEGEPSAGDPSLVGDELVAEAGGEDGADESTAQATDQGSDAATGEAPDATALAAADASTGEEADPVAMGAEPDAAPVEPEEPALTEAEIAKIEAELMLLEFDPNRVAPVEFEDYYVPPTPEPEEVAVLEEPPMEGALSEDEPAAEELVALVDEAAPEEQAAAEEAAEELVVVAEELMPSADEAPASEMDAEPLVLGDAVTELEAEPAVEGELLGEADPLDAQGEVLAESSAPEAEEPLIAEAEQPEQLGAEADTEVAAVVTDAPDEVSTTEPATAEPEDFAKFGAIQWEVVKTDPLVTVEPIALDAEGTPVEADPGGAAALTIEAVPVPTVATAMGAEWQAAAFLDDLPLAQRAVLGPLCVLDPSGGIASLSLAFDAVGQSSQSAAAGPPQDPALVGLTKVDGSQFDPQPIEPEVVAVDEPGIGLIWWSEELPTTQVDSPREVQTPSIGRVRVVMHSGDYVEGVMHSVGSGQYWIDGDLGRFAIRKGLVSHIERLPKPGLGQQVKGLQAGDLVRAKVKTGFIEGRLISLKDGKALVETATGMRITLSDVEVEPMGNSKTRVIVD